MKIFISVDEVENGYIIYASVNHIDEELQFIAETEETLQKTVMNIAVNEHPASGHILFKPEHWTDES